MSRNPRRYVRSDAYTRRMVRLSVALHLPAVVDAARGQTSVPVVPLARGKVAVYGGGAYTFAGARALSKDGRAWWKATSAALRASDRRMAHKVPTLVQLSVTVRERGARLTAWANANAGARDGRKSDKALCPCGRIAWAAGWFCGTCEAGFREVAS